MLRTNKQTDKQTDPNVLPTLTDRIIHLYSFATRRKNGRGYENSDSSKAYMNHPGRSPNDWNELVEGQLSRSKTCTTHCHAVPDDWL